MYKTIEIQSGSHSKLDQSKLCGFDVEIADAPTAPLIHQEARFLYFRKGAGILCLQGKHCPVKEGSLVAILPWQVSDIVKVDKTLQYYLITYHFDTVQRAAKIYHGERDDPQQIQSLLEQNPVVECGPEQREGIEYLLRALRDELGLESALEQTAADSFASTNTVSLLVQLTVLYCRLSLRQAGPKEEAAVDYVEILRYMYLHCNTKLTLKHLASVFYCSESTVSSYITQVTGLSFFDLLNEIRVGKTVNYLLYTDFTLKEMASFLGYVDESHISKVFFARLGMRIGEYRNTYQKIQTVCQIEESTLAYAVVNYVYRNYEKDLTAQNVARTFGISAPKLHQTLLYQLERNFEGFLNVVRVNRACELLLNTDKTVLEIAVEVGYHTAKTLTRNFLKLKIMTPGAYRLKLKNISSDILT